MRRSMTRLVAPIAVFLSVLTLYWRTLVPSVGVTDSGALVTAAWTGGVAHSPGFPLFLLATRAVMSIVPLQPPVRSANLAAALFGAAAAAAMTLVALALLHTIRRDEHETADSLIAAAAGLLLGTSRTLWNYATFAEVYTLHMLLMISSWGSLLVWYRTRRSRWLYVAALCFGLGLTVHHLMMALGAIAIATLIVRAEGVSFVRSPRFFIAAAALAAGLLPYLYLPLAASRGVYLNWGNPGTIGKFLDHVTAKQYRSYITSSNVSGQIEFFLGVLVRDFGPAWLPVTLLIAAAGFVVLFRRDRTLFWFVTLIVAANLVWVAAYPITNDRDAYLLPTIAAMILAMVAGARAIVGKRPVAFAAALFLLPVISAAAAWPYRDRSDFRVMRDYVDNALRPVGKDALLLTDDWQLYSPLLYFQQVEKLRPDVNAIQLGLLIRSWYLESLEKHDPELIRLVRAEFDTFKPMVELWERTPSEEWNRMAETRAEFFRRLNALVLAMIEKHQARGPVYATSDVVRSGDSAWVQTVQVLSIAYDAVPLGIVYQCVPRRAPRIVMPLTGAVSADAPPLPEVRIETRGLAGGTLSYEPGDVVLTEILPEYRSGFVMRARHYARLKQYERALAEYDRALALDPGNVATERERNLIAARSMH